MSKFKCISQKKEDWPMDDIEVDFPDKIMICIPMTNLLTNNLTEVYMLVPKTNKEEI